MPLLYDYSCQKCDYTEERIEPFDSLKRFPCPLCPGSMCRIVSVGRSAYNLTDAPWIATIREVVNKQSKSPADREFLKSPTRANYKTWMKANGLRHLDPGEAHEPKPWSKKDDAEIKDALLKKYMDRNRLKLAGC